MGPPCGLKEVKALFILHGRDSKACQTVACELCRQQSSVPRARDEENHSPAHWTRRTNRQSSRPTGGHRNVINNSNRVILDRVVHRGGYVSREILLLMSYKSQERLYKTMERKNVIIGLNTPMERKMCLNTSIRSISFRRTSRAGYTWQDSK